MAFNFSRTPFSNERLPRLAFGLAAALVTALTLVHGFVLTRNLLREQEALDSRVEELRLSLEQTEAEIENRRQTLARDESALKNEQTGFLTRMYRRKSFSWTGLFNELETITPRAVRVTAIAPEEEDNRIAVTMTIVGRTLADVLEMVRQLEASALFATVYPIDEASLDVSRGGEPGIAATLQLDYVEPPARPAAASASGAEAEAKAEAEAFGEPAEDELELAEDDTVLPEGSGDEREPPTPREPPR